MNPFKKIRSTPEEQIEDPAPIFWVFLCQIPSHGAVFSWLAISSVIKKRSVEVEWKNLNKDHIA